MNLLYRHHLAADYECYRRIRTVSSLKTSPLQNPNLFLRKSSIGSRSPTLITTNLLHVCITRGRAHNCFPSKCAKIPHPFPCTMKIPSNFSTSSSYITIPLNELLDSIPHGRTFFRRQRLEEFIAKMRD